MTEYLSIEQVVGLHASQIKRFGGSKGLRDRGGLEAAVARPQMTFGGDDLYPSVPDKAAALMHSLVMNHPFIDGNKRVGTHAALAFLLANDFTPLMSPDELAQTTLAVAEGKMPSEQLAIWIRQRSHEMER